MSARRFWTGPWTPRVHPASPTGFWAGLREAFIGSSTYDPEAGYTEFREFLVEGVRHRVGVKYAGMKTGQHYGANYYPSKVALWTWVMQRLEGEHWMEVDRHFPMSSRTALKASAVRYAREFAQKQVQTKEK